ncbi:MAG: sigma-54-dependent Fis family transcriptional regulator [Deltaproteobacteria bacterium]|nr:sigma-54-dependent Fis family transcriptional regulator [Deltaproteobacteria bacterium]
MEIDRRLENGSAATHTFIAVAHRMVRVREALEKAARADVRVVLYGEPGAGKEHAVRYLHRLGAAPSAPLVRIALRTPFTASNLADVDFVASHRGGTFLLEGVDEASSEVQAFLIAVLEDGILQQEEGESAVRVVATATRDLLGLAEAGHFRRDLYYLLEVFPVALPPLRERLEEVPDYLAHFHARYAPGHPPPAPPAEFLSESFAYSWPGNLRELENLVAASVAATGGSRWELPHRLPRQGSSPIPSTFQTAKRDFEAGYIRKLLHLTAGNITQAAELAGKARKDFYALLSRNGIEPRLFRR